MNKPLIVMTLKLLSRGACHYSILQEQTKWIHPYSFSEKSESCCRSIHGNFEIFIYVYIASKYMKFPQSRDISTSGNWWCWGSMPTQWAIPIFGPWSSEKQTLLLIPTYTQLTKTHMNTYWNTMQSNSHGNTSAFPFHFHGIWNSKTALKEERGRTPKHCLLIQCMVW